MFHACIISPPSEISPLSSDTLHILYQPSSTLDKRILTLLIHWSTLSTTRLSDSLIYSNPSSAPPMSNDAPLSLSLPGFSQRKTSLPSSSNSTLQTPISFIPVRVMTHVCCLFPIPPLACPLRGSCVPLRHSSTRRAPRRVRSVSYGASRPSPLSPSPPPPHSSSVFRPRVACTTSTRRRYGEQERGERDRQRDCFRVLSSTEQQRLVPVQC